MYRRARENASRYNGRFAGREVVAHLTNNKEYLKVSILGKSILLHRLVWALANNEWPTGEIDHINGDRLDNRLENLRNVTPAENRRNMARRSDNTSGCSGVIWDKAKRKWVVQITRDGRRSQLGSFHRYEHAVAHRRAEQSRVGFSERHGR